MKILVSGATGFLGRHLVPHLQAQGHEVVGFGSKKADLLEKESLLQFKDTRFDRIYHLAAWTKAGDFCLKHPGEQWVQNQLINTHMLWFWQAHQRQAEMVTMGTSCAYPPELELKEENYMVGEPDRDLYTYAMTKRMLFQGCRALNRQYGMKFFHLIPSTLFGPAFDAEDSHFIFDLIKKITRGKFHGDEVRLWGDGSQVRELIYIQDALSLMDRAIEKMPNDLVNLGSGVGLTIRSYAELLCRQIGYDPTRIVYDTGKFTGVPKKVFSVKKSEALGVALTPIEQALAVTVQDWLSRSVLTQGGVESKKEE